MTSSPAGAEGQPPENAAWASVAMPMSCAVLADFLVDVERLFRLNPYLEIESWQAGQGPFVAGKRYRLVALNEMNGLRQDLEMTLEAVEPWGYVLSYGHGLKRSTRVAWESEAGGCRLTLRDEYHAPSEAECAEGLKAVDRSLVPWAASVLGYLLRYRRWSWLPPYRWYAGRYWLGMSPRHRRIARLIIWTTLLEFVVFLFVFAIYWLESLRG
jgi:hypothetical protein